MPKQVTLMVAAITVAAIIGCQNNPVPKTKATSHTLIDHQGKQVVTTATKDIEKQSEPQKFGFTVQSVQTVMCCTDKPGKMSPSGSVEVEGLTPDNWRYLLHCPAERLNLTKTNAIYKPITKAEWKTVGTASLAKLDDLETLDLYAWSSDGPPYWMPVVRRCTIYSKLDRAKNVFRIKVNSSKANEWKSSDGYEVSAEDNDEIYTLRCFQGMQSPCVSVAAIQYIGVRDGSEIRLCNDAYKVISTFQIVDERDRR